jgi:hypothetical protein
MVPAIDALLAGVTVTCLGWPIVLASLAVALAVVNGSLVDWVIKENCELVFLQRQRSHVGCVGMGDFQF